MLSRFVMGVGVVAVMVIAIMALAPGAAGSGIAALVAGGSAGGETWGAGDPEPAGDAVEKGGFARPALTQPSPRGRGLSDPKGGGLADEAGAGSQAGGRGLTDEDSAVVGAGEASWRRWAPAPEASETVIGSSGEGRPLVVYHVWSSAGGTPALPAKEGSGPQPVLVLGGQHGGPEVNTSRLAWQLLGYFQGRPEELPRGLRLDVLPEANPDGLASGSRQFATGVDPNRNWGGADWAPDAADSNGTFRNGLGGPEPFSEPETQALRDYVLAMRPQLVVNYHSRGGFLFGGRTDRANEVADAYSAASGYYRPGRGPGTGAGSVLGYRATGSMNVWLATEELPGLLIELATSYDAEFARNLAGLKAALGVLAPE